MYTFAFCASRALACKISSTLLIHLLLGLPVLTSNSYFLTASLSSPIFSIWANHLNKPWSITYADLFTALLLHALILYSITSPNSKNIVQIIHFYYYLYSFMLLYFQHQTSSSCKRVDSIVSIYIPAFASLGMSSFLQAHKCTCSLPCISNLMIHLCSHSPII